jgi:hypothetical protein
MLKWELVLWYHFFKPVISDLVFTIITSLIIGIKGYAPKWIPIISVERFFGEFNYPE